MLRPVLLTSGFLTLALSACADPAGVQPNPSEKQLSSASRFGVGASLELQKLTNGEDADVPPGPSVAPGDPVTWEYRVTNAGSEDLTNVYVMDDKEGLICLLASLDPGQTATCTKSGVAREGAYQNLGTAVGYALFGGEIQAEDPSHYQGGASAEDGIGIDVKPGSDSNCVNPTSKGRLPVAILADAGFDPLTLDPATILAGGLVAPVHWGKGEDVTGDGLADLVVQFKTPELNAAELLLDGVQLTISGTTSSGETVAGSDVIHLVHGPSCR